LFQKDNKTVTTNGTSKATTNGTTNGTTKNVKGQEKSSRKYFLFYDEFISVSK
jgi:hypothetical protein